LRLEANAVINGTLDFLLASKVALCGLHRHVPEQKLDLFELSTCNVTESGACAAQIVGSNFLDTDRLGEVLNDVPHDLFGQPISPNDPALFDRAEETAGLGSRRYHPVINPRFDPVGNRHSANVTALAYQNLLLTDSGGIQEEAPSLGKPVLVLRMKTERPEAVASDAARLVGTDADAIVGEASRLLDDPLEYARRTRVQNLYGDGCASARIAGVIRSFFAEAEPGMEARLAASPKS
jgi:hypothetical protein